MPRRAKLEAQSITVTRIITFAETTETTEQSTAALYSVGCLVTEQREGAWCPRTTHLSNSRDRYTVTQSPAIAYLVEPYAQHCAKQALAR